ncbi:hypothetical protein M0R04_13390 [Candidatus Dojkabacteria bacterium]|jgi:hypothetical protein|nr:hypothetical protein [Candidatus Dojkabacteria bacterium]
MTKKDYVLIAENIKICLGRAQRTSQNYWEIYQSFKELVSNMGTDFENDNPKFDIEKFYKACGIVEAV